MTQRPSALNLLHLVALASLFFSFQAVASEEVSLPGAGTVVLGPDDTLELIFKPTLKNDDARGLLPQVKAWLIATGQAAPKDDAPESGRALVWPSPTRANEFIAHLRGLLPPKNDDAQAYDVLVRWSFPGSTEHGETLLKKAVEFRTGLPNVVLLLDGSGSMTVSDPEKSRIEAARRFIATGRTSGGIGSIGIIQFASQVRELLPLTPVGEDAKFQAALRSVTADGYTDIDTSVRKAVEMLRGPNGKGTGAIVLLTDGVQEPGVYGDAHIRARDAGIPVHTVALGPDADQVLLQRIADETGGTFSSAARGQELIRIYGAIAAGIVGGRTITSAPFPATPPRSLPILIDSTCRTLVASVASENSGTLTLVSPKGENESSDAAAHPVFYKVSPPTGNWAAQWSGAAGAKLEASAHTPLYPLFFRATTESAGVVELDPDDPRVALSLTEGATPLSGATIDVALDIPGRAERITTTLFDDGAHDDGTAGDGIYAGSFAKLGTLNLPADTSGTVSATLSGKRTDGETFRREVHAHWTLVRGSARGLVLARVLDLGTHFSGEHVTAALPVRVRGPGGTYHLTSKSPAAGTNSNDLSKILNVAANGTLPSRDAATLPLALELPDELGPGTYGGVIELQLDGERDTSKVSALATWRIQVRSPELALSRFAVLDLGSIAPGAQIQSGITLGTRGGRAKLAGIALRECSLWNELLRNRAARSCPFRIPRSEQLQLSVAPEARDIGERSQPVALTFTVGADSPAGLIERELVLQGSKRELGKVLVCVNVRPQWLELGGELNFGRLEPGESASRELPYKLAGAFSGKPKISASTAWNSPAGALTLDETQANSLGVALKLAEGATAGHVGGVVELRGGAAQAAARWTAEVVRPELRLSATALNLGSIYPGQTRRATVHASFRGVRPTPLTTALEMPPTKPLVTSIHLRDDALKISTSAATLQPGDDAEIALDLRVPDSAQDGIYKTQIKVTSRLGTVLVPVAFQVVYPIPLPPFHVTPIEVVLNVIDGQPAKPVTVSVISQSDEPLSIRAHCEPTAGLARISAELIRDGEAAPEKTFIVPGRGEARFHVRPLPDSEDGDQCQIIVESGTERQTVHAIVVRSRQISAVPRPQTEGFDWWTLLIIIPLMLCAVFVRKLVKRRWVRVAAYSGLLHFGIFFFIIIPQSHKDDSFGSVEATQGIDIDLTKLDDGGLSTDETDGGAGNDAPAAAGPRGGDGLAALGNAKEKGDGALAGLKDGGNGPGGPAAAAALQKAGAGDAAPAGSGPTLARGPSQGGPDEALAVNDDPGGAAPLEVAAKPEPSGAPAGAFVPITNSKIELPAGRSGTGVKQAASSAAAKSEAGGGNPNEKIVLVGAPGKARGDGQPLAMDDIPLIADSVGAPAPDTGKSAPRGAAHLALGEPTAPTNVSAVAATSNRGASEFGPIEKNAAPATRYVSGTSGAVVPENGKAWGEGGAEQGATKAGTESNRKTGLLVGRGDDDALDAGPVLGEGFASNGNSSKAVNASGAGGKDGASISGTGGAGLGGEGTSPRGGHGVTAAIGNGRGLGHGDGLGGNGSGSGDGIGRGAGPGNHGFGGPGGNGTGFGGKGGDGLGVASRSVGTGRGTGSGTGLGNGNGHGFGDAPLDFGGSGSGTGGNGKGTGAGTGNGLAGNGSGAGSGNGTGIGVGNGDGGPGSPRGIPGGVGTLGGRGTGGNDIGIASGGSGHGLGIGSQTGGVASGLGDGIPGSGGESLTSRTIGNGRGTGSGSGRPGSGDAPLDAGPLGTGNGAGTVASGNGSGNGNGKGVGDEGPPGPRGNGGLGASGLSNGKGTGGGGTALAGNGLGTGDLGAHGPASSGLSGSEGSGWGAGGSHGGKASVTAALDSAMLDRSGKNSGAGKSHEGAQTHDRPHWGPPTGTVLRVNLGLAQHSADWNSSPTALFNLATAFRERCGLPDVEAEVKTVKLDDSKSMGACRLILFTANYAIPFTDAEIASMRKYAENGGTLWFNDSGASGDERFDIALRKDLERLFPGTKLEKLESTHPLFHSAYDLTHGYKGYRIPPGDKYRQEYMEGITLTGRDGKPRTALIYTRNDYADGLEIDPRNIAGRPSLTDLTADEMLEGSLRFGMNLLAYSLGSDAPQMPPPPESTAQFEKIYRYNGPQLPVVENFATDIDGDGKPLWTVQDWGNPAQVQLVDNAGGGHALKITFKAGDKMKAAAGRNIELNLGTSSAVVVDIYSSLPHGFNVALLFSTKPDWLGYESRPIFIRPGWNRNVRFPLELDDFKTAKNEWKTYDQAFKPRDTVGRVDFLLYNLNENGEVKIESIRVQSQAERN